LTFDIRHHRDMKIEIIIFATQLNLTVISANKLS